MLVLIGCKGHLPNSVTSKASATIPGKITPVGLPGTKAPDLIGQIVFGRDPRQPSIPNEILVVTRYLHERTPCYFNHSRFFPQVHWVQYVDQEYADETLKTVDKIVRSGDPADGLTILTYDRKTQNSVWIGYTMTQYYLVQNGKIIGQAQEEDLEKTLSQAVLGKLDSKAQAIELTSMLKDEQRFSKEWYDQVFRFQQGKMELADFRHRIILDMTDGRTKLAARYGSYFLMAAGCRPMADIQPVLDQLSKCPERADALSSDISSHLHHDECRNRVLEDIELAKDDPMLKAKPYFARNYANFAIALKKKDLAIYFANLILKAPMLKPRYAKHQREYYEAEVEDMLYRANHIQNY